MSARRDQLDKASAYDPLTVLGQRYWPTYVRTVDKDGEPEFRPLGLPVRNVEQDVEDARFHDDYIGGYG